MKHFILSILTITLFGCGQETSKQETSTKDTLVNNDTIQTTTPVNSETFVDNYIIEDIIKYYETEHGQNARVEKDNKDSLLTLAFYSKEDISTIPLITIYIPKLKIDYLLGDLNNDKVDDLVANIETLGGGGGGNVHWNDIFVFISKNGKFELKNTTQSPKLCGSYDGYFNPESIIDNVLVGNSYCYDKNDGTCCPSLFFFSKVKFNNNKLDLITQKKYVTQQIESEKPESKDTTFKINNENYKVTINTYSSRSKTIADTSEGVIRIYPETINEVIIKSGSKSKTIMINKPLFKHIYNPQTLYHSNFGRTDIKEIDSKNKKIILYSFFAYNESDFGEILNYSLTLDGVFEFISAEEPKFE